MAFVLAGIVAICTILLAFFVAYANGMSDNMSPDAQFSVTPIYVIGFLIAGALVASHYIHLSW